MDFQNLYQKIRQLDEGDMNQGTGIMAPPSTPAVEECGMGEMGGCSAHQEVPKQQDSVSMNVNMNASGAGGIRDLMNILKNIEHNVTAPDDDSDKDVVIGEPDTDIIDNIEPVSLGEPPQPAEQSDMHQDEEFANEPEFQEFDNIISGSDLHKEKNAYPAAQKGDNAMASIKKAAVVASISESLVNRLANHYNEVKNRN